MHPFKGTLFESFAIAELYKYFFNKNKTPSLFYWRDVQGHEIDVIDIARGKGYTKLAHYLEIAPALRRNVLCAVLQQIAQSQCGRWIEQEMIEEILAWLVVAENQAPLKKGV